MNIDFFVLLLQTQFDITVASEIMAILALTTDLQDMRKRFALYMFLFSCRIPLTSEHMCKPCCILCYYLPYQACSVHIRFLLSQFPCNISKVT